MKKYFLLITIWLTCFSNSAQLDSTRGYIKPMFKGGTKEFQKYFYKYSSYPPMEREMGIEANLTATIFISKEGKIKFVNVLGKEQIFKNEVKRILTLMPDWIRGKLNGIPIDTIVTQQIFYSLQTSRVKKDS